MCIRDRPTTITIRPSGAVRSVSGRTTPPYTIRVAQKSKMAKPYTSLRNAFFMQQVRKSWAVVRTRAQFSCFLINFAKENEKNMSTKIAQIEISFEPELNFCNFWWLQNEPPKALWTPTWLQHFPKTRQDFTKESQKFNVKQIARTVTDIHIK